MIRSIGVAAFLSSTLLAAGGARGVTAIRAPGASPLGPSTRAAAALTCHGPRDLLVDTGQRTLSGLHSFAHVCVRDGGTLRAGARLILRAGSLYVDAASRISGDGLPGYEDCRLNQGGPDGEAGQSMTVLAYTATILGALSATGGAGLNADDACSPGSDGGSGGAGGAVTFEAAHLTLRGQVSVAGGAGGAASESAPGRGGPGGRITIVAPRGILSAPTPRLDTRGGGDGGGNGRGKAGQASIDALTPAQAAALPPPARPDRFVTTAGAVPVYRPLEPLAVFGRGMDCGAGDLVVAGRVSLSGNRFYPHVCIEGRGVLRATGQLTLRARSIMIALGAVLDANGVVGPKPGRPADGRYRGIAGTGHAPPPPGVPGANGEITGPGETAPKGGKAGGAIALIADGILIAGGVQARGADGAVGIDGAYGGPDYFGPGRGAGGGSGGGLLIMARELQISGAISVAGGMGGLGGAANGGPGMDADMGDPGSPGLVKLVAGTLRLPASGVPVDGPTILSRVAPPDLALPPGNGS